MPARTAVEPVVDRFWRLVARAPWDAAPGAVAVCVLWNQACAGYAAYAGAPMRVLGAGGVGLTALAAPPVVPEAMAGWAMRAGSDAWWAFVAANAALLALAGVAARTARRLDAARGPGDVPTWQPLPFYAWLGAGAVLGAVVGATCAAGPTGAAGRVDAAQSLASSATAVGALGGLVVAALAAVASYRSAASRASARGHHLRAAALYCTIGDLEDAAEALRQAGRFVDAAELFERRAVAAGRGSLAPGDASLRGPWERAGRCWEAAHVWHHAARAYEEAGLHEDAARCFGRAGLPDEARRVRRLAAESPHEPVWT
jgi:hypothetical protein